MRRVALLAVLGVIAVPGPASHGAPTRSCNLISDPRGDVYAVRTQPTGLPDKALDVVAGDLASDDVRLTAVVRVDDLLLPPVTSPLGANYEVHFRISGSRLAYVLLASTSPGAPDTFRLLITGGGVPIESTDDVTGVFDLTRDEVRVSVDLETLGQWHLVQRGERITVDGAYSGRGVLGEGPFADHALEGTRVYRAGARSCVVMGR